jgi:7-cyano-7-deazaguanine synthase
MDSDPRPAIVLTSGGLDSTTCLAMAKHAGYCPLYSMSFDYGQRHRFELVAAQKVASQMAWRSIGLCRSISASSAKAP